MTLVPETSRHLLSKSTFVRGCQCLKSLWLHKHQPELKAEISDAQMAVFSQGTSVGMLARDLFPGGVDASPETPYAYQKSVAETARFIGQQHTVIYEAAFQFEQVLAAMDILVKKKNKWYAYEVKSSTGVKEQFITDAALQYYVITNAGIPLEDICIVHIDSTYVRQGRVQVEKLFTSESVLDQVLKLQPFIKNKITELKQVLIRKEVPQTDIGPHCYSPYDCDFKSHCWKHIPPDNVFELRGNGGFDTAMELYVQGIIRINDIPENFVAGSQQTVQITAHKNQEDVLDKKELKKFLKEIQYPVYHMDFETFGSAVPEFDGCHPYQQIPFQYSIHIQKTKDAKPEALAFLAEAGPDPRRDFILSLIRDLGKNGTVLAYNSSFENRILNELLVEFPDLKNEINAIQDRVLDLMQPFRKKHFYMPQMKGSYSIKEVLPALVPELRYDALNISNGAQASAIYFSLKNEKDEKIVSQTRKDLLEYCGLDTLAMVKILDRLNASV